MIIITKFVEQFAGYIFYKMAVLCWLKYYNGFMEFQF